MSIRAFTAVAVLLLSSASQSATTPRQPTSKWIVHFEDTQCVAERNYGSEKKPLSFALKQPAVGDVMQLDIIESAYAGAPAQVDGQVQFDGGGPIKVSVLRFAPPKEKYRIHMMNLPIKQFDSNRSAKSVRVSARIFDENFALTELGPLLDLMDQCAASLGKMWNVRRSADGNNEVREDAKGKLLNLFKSEDYPWHSLMNDESGQVTVALLVNEQGRVADCSVIQTSGVAMLDAQSCVVLKDRATFIPAIGKDGKPAKDAFLQKINWKVSS